MTSPATVDAGVSRALVRIASASRSPLRLLDALLELEVPARPVIESLWMFVQRPAPFRISDRRPVVGLAVDRIGSFSMFVVDDPAICVAGAEQRRTHCEAA